MAEQIEQTLEQIAEVVERIKDVLDTLPDEAKDWQPEPEEWSAKMIVAHLLNCEPYFQERLTRILAEENPTVPGFGPEEARPETDLEFDDLLNAYTAARQETLKLVADCSSKDWKRLAFHEVLGATTLAGQLQLIADHDIEHTQQIENLRSAWSQ